MIETTQGGRRSTNLIEADPDVSARRVTEVRRVVPGSRSIVQTASDRLQRNPNLRHDAVCCEFRQGVLSLYGRLPSYYQKQVAQEAVRGLEGVRQVVNHIEVEASAISSREAEDN